MLLGQKQLKPNESRYFTIDYTKWLLSNETVVAAVAAVAPVTVPALTVAAQVVSGGKQVTTQVSGGLASTQYIIEVTADTIIDNSPDPDGAQTKVDCFGVDVIEECVA